jgi:hypothetical protein
MIVSELINKLQELPQDALVLARGYESGYDAVETVEHRLVHDTKTKNSYDGKYDYNWMEKDNVSDDISAVLLES